MKYTKHTVGLEDVDQRLDRFLVRLYPRVAKSLWQKGLRQKDIRVNGSLEKPAYRLCDGDEVSIFTGLLNVSKDRPSTIQIPDSALLQKLKKELLYQGDDFSVLNKPQGYACQGGTGLRMSLDKILPHVFERDVYLVHRLDKDTSGALLVAHSASSAAFFAKAFQEKRICKTYIAIVAGQLPRSIVGRKYTSFVQKVPRGSCESMMCFDTPQTGAQEARTRFDVLEEKVKASLVRMKSETGRKHQLRVQTAHLGAPIWGDDRYGTKSASGLCLHAWRLALTCPQGKQIVVQAPFPDSFIEAARRLGFSDDFNGAKKPEQKESKS